VALDIRFISATQNIDTDESNPTSRFMLHIFAAVAELEREMIRERVVSGIRAAQAKGKTLGRPRRVFRRDEALRLRTAGVSWRRIAQLLNVPMSTVIDSCREAANSRDSIPPLTGTKHAQSSSARRRINGKSSNNQRF